MIHSHTHTHTPKRASLAVKADDSHNLGRISACHFFLPDPANTARADPHKFRISTQAPYSSANTHQLADKIFYFPISLEQKRCICMGFGNKGETLEALRIILAENEFCLHVYDSSGID